MTGGVEAETPIEDRIDADKKVAAKKEAYLAAKGDSEADPCSDDCETNNLRGHRLELARARSAAHKRVSEITHPDVVAASELAEG